MSKEDEQGGAQLGHDPGPGPGGLYDVARLAQRLGIERSSIRSARHRGADWMPEPAGTLNGGPVWFARSLEGIEDRRRGPGRPRTQ